MMRRLLQASVLAATACVTPSDPVRTFSPIEQPEASEVAGVLFLVGDAGNATTGYSPILHKLRQDIEKWSASLADSAVVVVFLGDNVYPEGLRDRLDPSFLGDSTRLHGQVWTVEGPEARAHDARGFFLAGNHDWGNLAGPDGIKRLGNMDRALRSYAQDGIDVRLTPSAGDAGPQSFRLGDFATLITLDTSWWMQAGNDPLRDLLLDGLGDALSATDDRLNVVVAHHPYRTAGAHSGLLGPRSDPYWLLRRTGVIVQSQTSSPFKELLAGLEDVFARTTPPFIYAGGHDHSLQLFEASQPSDPTYSIVSGAGSKLTAVAEAKDLVWASRALGFMRILFRVDGGAEVYVEVIDEALSDCEERFNARESCLEHGVDAFRTVYSKRLR